MVKFCAAIINAPNNIKGAYHEYKKAHNKIAEAWRGVHVQNIEASVNEGCSLGQSSRGNGKQAQGSQNCSSKATVEFSLALKIEMHAITNINIVRKSPKSSMAPKMSVRYRL